MASMSEYCLPGQVGAIFPLQMITNDRKQQDETNNGGLSQQDCAFHYPYLS